MDAFDAKHEFMPTFQVDNNMKDGVARVAFFKWGYNETRTVDQTAEPFFLNIYIDRISQKDWILSCNEDTWYDILVEMERLHQQFRMKGPI